MGERPNARSYGGRPRSAILSSCPMITTERGTEYGPGVGVPGARYQWFAKGDINAFFGLMLDNVVNLAVLAGILVAGFGIIGGLLYLFGA